ncbi:hypothetical protein EV182_000796 [Spiromyces aspiralis]|uniref:Uncharacterized protein n=1 Tax=Spiromyces aspiralis TaxID=68401 RepID=A0ACC1HTX1_9FUNG|nr:hypothetical protein EV182_000796 [Spiromyces aspiralis]
MKYKTQYQKKLAETRVKKNQRTNVRRRYFHMLERDEGVDAQPEFLRKLITSDEGVERDIKGDASKSEERPVKEPLHPGNVYDKFKLSDEDEGSGSEDKDMPEAVQERDKSRRKISRKVHPYAKFIEKRKVEKRDKQIQRKIMVQEHEERKRKIQATEGKRRRTVRKLTEKTKHGQPNLRNQVEHLLEKIQKST